MVQFKKAFLVLSPKARRRMFLLIPVLLIGMALETLSIGMVIPALGVLLQKSYLDQFPDLNSFLDIMGNPSHTELIAIGLVALAATFACKNAFLLFQVLCQGTFVYGAQREIAVQLFHRYLNRSYKFHLETNSSKLIRNLTTEVNSFCSYFLMPFLNLLSEVLVILAILVFIFWIEPAGTICLGLALGGLGFVFFRTTNRLVGSWGQHRLLAEESKIKYLQQGFGGIKEIILSGKLSFFVNKFHTPNRVSGLMFKREYIFQYLPKQGVEVLAVIGLTGMCLYFLSQERSSLEIMHMLGLMATAGFRLIPSFSRILTNLQSIRFGWASVEVLSSEFYRTEEHNQSASNERKNESQIFSFKHQISLENITFNYEQDNTSPVLKNISIDILKGESIAFIGESGSGKSTLANLILGLVTPNSGKIVCDGIIIDKSMHTAWQKNIGYVPQDVYLMDDSLRRNIAFGYSDNEIDDERVECVIEMSQLNDFVKNSKDGVDMILGERGIRISGGQKQRIGIARALYNDPEILIFDEATSALDSKTEEEILSMLEPLRGKKTFLMIAHRKSSIKGCDRIFRVDSGSLILEENPSV